MCFLIKDRLHLVISLKDLKIFEHHRFSTRHAFPDNKNLALKNPRFDSRAKVFFFSDFYNNVSHNSLLVNWRLSILLPEQHAYCKPCQDCTVMVTEPIQNPKNNVGSRTGLLGWITKSSYFHRLTLALTFFLYSSYVWPHILKTGDIN